MMNIDNIETGLSTLIKGSKQKYLIIISKIM